MIDAAGVERAYLGPVEGKDLIADTVQCRVRSARDPGMQFKLNSIGYEWRFPLGNGEHHLGFGNLKVSS